MLEMDAAWAAGLFEGEGTIECTDRGTANPRLAVAVTMADLDVLERLQDIAGYGIIIQIQPRQPHHKMQWRWQCNNIYAGRFLEGIGHHLGKRRRGRANEALAQWHGGYRVMPGRWATVQEQALKGVPECL